MELEDIIPDDELRKLTKENLVDYALKLNLFAYDTLIDGNAYMYHSLNKQMKSISKQIAEVTIDITAESDMDLFDNIIKLAEKSDKISEGLEKVQGRIKSNQKGHIKDAEIGSPEWYADKKKSQR